MTATNKDTYICSTVRHLLFSLYKAQDSNNQAVIIFFYDFQNIEPQQFDLTQLPDNIDLILANRKSLVKHIKKSGLIGRLILFCSLRGIPVSNSILYKLSNLLQSYDSNLNFTIDNLFLFNDNNKMSRLFRLLNQSYSMIEDGMGNYIEHTIDSIPKQVLRYLQGKQPKYYVFGEKDQCREVFAIHPDNLPNNIIHKGKQLTLSKDKAVVDTIKTCFRFKDIPGFSDGGLIIATQPVFTEIKDKLISDDFFLTIYRTIISLSKERGIVPVLKLHPLEKRCDYECFEHEGIEFLSSKLPLELYLLSTSEKTNIITINSSVGIGMEEYCNV
ncbi:glycosyltransferase family 52, partial [Vibrio sp. 10N.261.52.A1]